MITRILRRKETKPHTHLTIPTVPPISEKDLKDVQAWFRRPKFFVFGYARSGTTLLARLLRSHPQIHCRWEGHFFTRLPSLASVFSQQSQDFWYEKPANQWHHDRPLTPLLMRVSVDFLLERDSNSNQIQFIGDKSPNNPLHGQAVELTHKIYPDAFIIFIIRDGRDVMLSHHINTMLFFPEHLSQPERKLRERFFNEPEHYLQSKKSLFLPEAIRYFASEWKTNIETTVAMGQNLYGQRFKIVRYEDLLAKPLITTATVWRFLGAPEIADANERIFATLSVNPDQRNQYRHFEKLQAVFPKGRAQNWKRFLNATDVKLFNSIARGPLSAWDYDID